CPEALVALGTKGELERVALDGRSVRARSRLDGREAARVPTGCGFGERAGPQGSVARALCGETPVAREAPGPADQHPNSDPLALGVCQCLDATVLRRD